MQASSRSEALIEAIENRLAEISERQHALAVERTYLAEQLTPLRLGVASPEVALIQLRSRGIVLRGLAGAWAGDRRPDGAVLRALPPQKIRLASLPASQPRSA
jgi:hypothetical protein